MNKDIKKLKCKVYEVVVLISCFSLLSWHSYFFSWNSSGILWISRYLQNILLLKYEILMSWNPWRWFSTHIFVLSSLRLFTFLTLCRWHLDSFIFYCRWLKQKQSNVVESLEDDDIKGTRTGKKPCANFMSATFKFHV